MADIGWRRGSSPAARTGARQRAGLTPASASNTLSCQRETLHSQQLRSIKKSIDSDHGIYRYSGGASSSRWSVVRRSLGRSRHARSSRSRRWLDKMDKDYLVLKRASTSRPSGEWTDDDFDVLADGAVVGRIMKVHAAPEGSPWMWTLAFGHHEDRWPMI